MFMLVFWLMWSRYSAHAGEQSAVVQHTSRVPADYCRDGWTVYGRLLGCSKFCFCLVINSTFWLVLFMAILRSDYVCVKCLIISGTGLSKSSLGKELYGCCSLLLLSSCHHRRHDDFVVVIVVNYNCGISCMIIFTTRN